MGVSKFNSLQAWILSPHLFAAYTLGPVPTGYSSYGSPGADSASDLCYCNTVGYSIFSACAACQGDTYVPCGCILAASQLSVAYCKYLSLAGQHGLPTARRFFLLLREFLVAPESIRYDIIIGL